jgi:hypothetical protein
MYEAEPDPYCYPDSTVIKNIADLRSQDELEEFETAMTFARSEEPLPSGRLSSPITNISTIISFRISIPGQGSSEPSGSRKTRARSATPNISIRK